LVAQTRRTSVARAADAHDRALLEDAQQLALRVEGQLADLVEEQRAGRCGLEEARLRAAEQLVLDERLGQRRAVEPDERTGAPRAESVDLLGDDLLADAGLADHEHGDRRRCDALGERHHLLHQRIDDDRLGIGAAGRARVAIDAAQPIARDADQLADVGAVLGKARGAKPGGQPDGDGGRPACDRDGRVTIRLGQDERELLGAVLGNDVHPPQLADERLDVLGHQLDRALDAQHHEAERALVTDGAIDLGIEPVLELADGRDLAGALRGARARDDRARGPDDDDVTDGEPARCGDRRAIDDRAVTATEVLDLDVIAAALDLRVPARHAVVVDLDVALIDASEQQLPGVVDRDDPRAHLLAGAGDDQVPGAVRGGTVVDIDVCARRAAVVASHPVEQGRPTRALRSFP